jgi:hypothetical protein
VHAGQAREMRRARLRGEGHTLDEIFGFRRLTQRKPLPTRR